MNSRGRQEDGNAQNGELDSAAHIRIVDGGFCWSNSTKVLDVPEDQTESISTIAAPDSYREPVKTSKLASIHWASVMI